MSAYKLTIAYDGGPFAGWAAQPGLKTIQGELEGVLEQVLQRPVRLTVAGRTDADRIQELRASPGGQLDGHGLAVGPGGAPAALQGEEFGILIEELELGVRSYNCLKRAGIQTVGDLVQRSESELNAIPNFGKRSTDEVKDALNALGLSLRDE